MELHDKIFLKVARLVSCGNVVLRCVGLFAGRMGLVRRMVMARAPPIFSEQRLPS